MASGAAAVQKAQRRRSLQGKALNTEDRNFVEIPEALTRFTMALLQSSQSVLAPTSKPD